MTAVVRPTTTLWEVTVGGATLDGTTADSLEFGVVDQSLHRPTTVELQYNDPDFVLADGSTFSVGKALKVSAKSDDVQQQLFDGEVVAVELLFGEDMVSRLVVRAADKLHRLQKRSKNRVFTERSASDIASAVIAEAGLSAQVDSSNPVMPSVVQAGESDADLLARLASEIGYAVWAEGDNVHFKPLPEPSTPVATLTWGSSLTYLNASVSGASAYKEVEVAGWDPKQKKEILQKAPVRTSSSVKNGVTSVPGASDLRPSTLRLTAAWTTSGLATTTAKAIAERMSATLFDLEAEADGNPKVAAGKAVKVEGVGQKVSGTYLVTSARHHFRAGAYRTVFLCSPDGDPQLGGAHVPAGRHALPQGVVLTAIVTNLKDPENLGRMKVKLPSVGTDIESDWLRPVFLGSGPERGVDFMPEVNDEVLVLFDDGFLRQGYVLGTLHNGKDKPPTTHNNGKIDQRVIKSVKGHRVLFSDKQGEEHLLIETGDAQYVLKLDQKDKAILLTSGGKITMTSTGEAMIESQNKLTIKAAQDLALEGMNVSIKGQTGVKVDGAKLDLQASGVATLKGASVSIG